MQGLPQAEAAGRLNWSERTLRRRLAEARERLRGRLARRGLAPHGVALPAVFGNEARAAVPAAWNASVVRAAMPAAHAAVATVSAAAQSLTREVLKAMFIRKLTIVAAALLGAGLMMWTAGAAPIPREDDGRRAAEASTPRRVVDAPAPAVEPDPLDAVGTFPVRGRVLDPEGKPVEGAGIYIHHYSLMPAIAATSTTPPRGGSVRVAASGRDGSFRFDLDRSASDFPYRDYPVWHEAQIAAVAPGYGPAWVQPRALLKGGEAEWRLVRDDVPIRGRVVDPQGRPIAGVSVFARELFEPAQGVDLDEVLASGAAGLTFWRAGSFEDGPSWLGPWTTDTDGRFEVRGIGRDRLVGLDFRHPTLANTFLRAMSRTLPPSSGPRPRSKRPAGRTMAWMPPEPPIVGATFEHVVGPTRPITGVVRLKATGRPIAGVSVVGTEGATGTQATSVTDAEGRFRLVGLPKARTYEVEAAPRPGVDPFLGVRVTVGDTGGLKPIETALELPKGVLVTARLVDPVTGRAVRAKHAHHLKLPTNRNEGDVPLTSSGLVDPAFRLTVPPGGGMLIANVRGSNHPYTRARLRDADRGKGLGGPGDNETYGMALHASHAYKMLDIPADSGPSHVDLPLTRGLTRKGRLIDPDGKPVVGARCFGMGATWGFVETLADDTFEVRGLEPGYPRLLAFAHQGRRLVGSVLLKDADLKTDRPLEVRLGPGGTLKGRLVDGDGLPLADARLSVVALGPDGANFPAGPDGLWPDSVTFAADADGRFEVVGLNPGVKCLIDVRIDGQPGVEVNTGGFLRNVVFKRQGEVRDIGKVRVKLVRGGS